MRLIALINSMGDVDQSWGGGPVLCWMCVPLYSGQTNPWSLLITHCSFAEANLSIICATLTTVKPFVKHIAPRILGTTDPASKDQYGPDPNTFATSSAANNKPRYDKYERFDNGPIYPLQTITRAEATSRDTTQNVGTTEWFDTRHGSEGDSGSEKAIVQTRTTTVTYSA